MIFFKPTVNSDSTILFEAIENDEIYGSCTLDLSEKNAVVKSIYYDSDKPYMAEGLIKSAFNYAASRNYYMGVCECENIDSLLLRLGFGKHENCYISDIPTILTGSCCKN